MKKLKGFFFSLIFIHFSLSAGEFNIEIKKIETNMIIIYNTLFDKTYPPDSLLNNIKNMLENIPEVILDQLPIKNKNDYEKLKYEFSDFKLLCSYKANFDFLQKSFKQLMDKFHLIFCDQLLENLKSSKKNKIILFSTSVSCHCTLEKCAEYKNEIYLLNHRDKDKIDFLVIDAYERKDLKRNFKVDFIPTLLLLDKNDREIKRIVLDGKIDELLNFKDEVNNVK